jgi:hypothetical protein
MQNINRAFVRLAMAIHSHLAGGTHNPTVDLPTASWDRVNDLAKLIRRARYRGWHLAAESISKDLAYVLPSLESHLAAIREELTCSRRPANHVLTANEIYSDLQSLDEEFADLDFDLKRKTLSVTTEPIELEGVYLGPFEIQLFWMRPLHTGPPAYEVIAKDPHPCESRRNVTHPHVMDNVLCEGDGHAAIRQALAAGRLFDFFTPVASILRTYNSESPFVELSLWGGTTCSDCGATVSEEYSYSCYRCEDTLCGECETRCGGCEECFCSGCTATCAACEDSFCRSCLKTCEGCQRRVCEGCLEDERCTKCHEEDSNEEGAEESSSAPVSAPVHADSLGEAAVPT